MVGGGRPGAGEWGRDRAAPRGNRDRAVVGAALRRRLEGAEEREGRLGRRRGGGCGRQSRDRGGDELVTARAYQATTCAVPIDGSAATDASVRALSHADAYPISFVTLRRLGKRGVRPIVAAFVKYVTGPRAGDSFRQRGMLMVGDTWPAVPGS